VLGLVGAGAPLRARPNSVGGGAVGQTGQMPSGGIQLAACAEAGAAAARIPVRDVTAIASSFENRAFILDLLGDVQDVIYSVRRQLPGSLREHIWRLGARDPFRDRLRRSSFGPASAAPHQPSIRSGDHAHGRGRRWQSFERLAARNPRITELVTIGKTHREQEIVALKVSRRTPSRRPLRRRAARA
jgi:hypothetical protein